MNFSYKRHHSRIGEISSQTIMVVVLGLVIASGIGITIWQVWGSGSDSGFNREDVKYICMNKKCASFEKQFTPPPMDEKDQDMQGMMEFDGKIIKCPDCGKMSAFHMTKCPKCEHYWVDDDTLALADSKGPRGRRSSDDNKTICPECGTDIREFRRQQKMKD